MTLHVQVPVVCCPGNVGFVSRQVSSLKTDQRHIQKDIASGFVPSGAPSVLFCGKQAGGSGEQACEDCDKWVLVVRGSDVGDDKNAEISGCISCC